MLTSVTPCNSTPLVTCRSTCGNSAVRYQVSAISNQKSAIELYKGLFLQGFSLPDSVPFEEWLSTCREHYTKQAVQTLHDLADYHAGREEYEPAIQVARRQFTLEPW